MTQLTYNLQLNPFNKIYKEPVEKIHRRILNVFYCILFCLVYLIAFISDNYTNNIYV